MTVSISSPEDAVNAALVRIGYRGPLVDNMQDGTPAAMAALQVYGQTRDDQMRVGNWQFAQRDTSLTLLKSAPAGGYITGITTWTRAAYPPQAWLYEFAYPSDCLKVRIVKPGVMFVPNFNPGPNPWAIDNDNAYTPSRKVILSNVGPDALITYTGRITDPSLWEASFVESFIGELGARIAPVLTKLEAAQLSAIVAERDTDTAKKEQG